MKCLKIILPLLLIYLNASAQEKTWSLLDRAAIAGYLVNPGFEISYNVPKEKHLKYHCYYDKSYLSKDSVQLVRKTVDFFNFFYMFVLQQQKHIIDTVSWAASDLKKSLKYSWNGTFESFTKFTQLDEDNRLLLFLKILVFPVKCSIALSSCKQNIILDLDIKHCPRTNQTIDTGHYAKLIAWVCKDYVISKGSPKFNGILINYRDGKKRISHRYYDFDDREAFQTMYDEENYEVHRVLRTMIN